MQEPKVDEYIEKSAPFARPILTHLRELVHTACPNVKEVIKWKMPCFEYKGMLCNMASFKVHCAFGFWKGKLMPDPKGVLTGSGESSSMGNFGKITSMEDLPPDEVIIIYIKEAVKLNEQGVKVPKSTKSKEAPPTPSDLQEALDKNEEAKANFEGFSPSHKREYIDWIEEAKTVSTRSKRIETTVDWVAEGKSRNWKYKK